MRLGQISAYSSTSRSGAMAATARRVARRGAVQPDARTALGWEGVLLVEPEAAGPAGARLLVQRQHREGEREDEDDRECVEQGHGPPEGGSLLSKARPEGQPGRTGA